MDIQPVESTQGSKLYVCAYLSKSEETCSQAKKHSSTMSKCEQ